MDRYRIYVDIMTGGNYGQFRLLTRTSFIVQFVYTVGGEVSYEFHLNDNLVIQLIMNPFYRDNVLGGLSFHKN